MKKILVIDDELGFRETIGTLLRHKGYEVLDAPDGLAGVKLARTNKPDLVISDVIMEPVDGYMTLSILRQQPDTSRIPFVLVTGNGESAGVRKGLVLGADDYLHKPFTPDELLQTVGNLLDRRNASLEAAAEQVNRLRSLLAEPLDGPMNDTVSSLSGDAAQLSASCAAAEDGELKDLGARMFGTALRLRREIQRSILLAQVEVIAGSPDAVEVLRQAENCSLGETVDVELRREAERQGRSSDLQVNIRDARVQIGSLALSKVLEELIGDAFQCSPANSSVFVTSSASEQHVSLSIENRVSHREPRGVGDPAEPAIISREPEPVMEAGDGLWFARRLVEIHGGKLNVIRRSKHRAAVHLNLPVSRPSRELN